MANLATLVFIALGYLRWNAQNRHPFHHLPLEWAISLARGPLWEGRA